jgi:hypothetical protein
VEESCRTEILVKYAMYCICRSLSSNECLLTGTVKVAVCLRLIAFSTYGVEGGDDEKERSCLVYIV